MYHEKSVSEMATDEELIRLGKIEHPILRTLAFREMLDRKTFDHFDVIMEHLDDTAIVAIARGEWGIQLTKVSDDILYNARWKTIEAKNKTKDEVITKHKYLRSAYYVISRMEPDEKYYPHIKDMFNRIKNYSEEFSDMRFEDKQYAAIALAKFKKPGDIKLIKEFLLTNRWRIDETSFTLMGNYPDTSYMEVFENNYPRNFYRSICDDKNVNKATDFIKSIAVYKNDRSARILDPILNKKPFVNCPADSNSLKYDLIYAIWNNPCSAYAKLRDQVRARVKAYEEDYKKNSIELPYEPGLLMADSSEEKIRWW